MLDFAREQIEHSWGVRYDEYIYQSQDSITSGESLTSIAGEREKLS